MKKLLLVLGLVTLTTNVSFGAIEHNLKYGQRGDSVLELQEFLIDKGLLTGSPTGYFGLLTLKGVKAYQASQKLPSTGFVGPMTRDKINAEIGTLLDESNQAEKTETGTSTPVGVGIPTAPVATTTIVYVPVPTTPTTTPRVVRDLSGFVIPKTHLTTKVDVPVTFEAYAMDKKGDTYDAGTLYVTYEDGTKNPVLGNAYGAGRPLWYFPDVFSSRVYTAAFATSTAGIYKLNITIPKSGLSGQITVEVTE